MKTSYNYKELTREDLLEIMKELANAQQKQDFMKLAFKMEQPYVLSVKKDLNGNPINHITKGGKVKPEMERVPVAGEQKQVYNHRKAVSYVVEQFAAAANIQGVPQKKAKKAPSISSADLFAELLK